MERKIFLEKNRSKFSVNKPNKMGVDLDTKSKLMQNSGIMGNFSLFEQYNAERDACDKFRMIFVVNPVCSNVLFNTQTEIVQNEGSDSPVVIDGIGYSKENIRKADGTAGNSIVNSQRVTRLQAIKDTEYSHPQNGGFVYHCGLDIFNNHMLRATEFFHVNKINPENKYNAGEPRSEEVYNTLSDYIRDGNGMIVENAINPSSIEKTKLRLYTADNSMTMRRAYLTRIQERDGWIGFTNPGSINIPNSDEKDEHGNEVLINQMLAGNKPCEFIDMYPDRSLYSFIPKYNKFRDRIEKNWDYCLTYPYAKDKEMVNTVCGGKAGAIKVNFERGHNASSVSILMCRPLFKHTLKANSQIAIYYKRGTEFVKYPVNVKVTSVGYFDGSDTDRYFSIKTSDVQKILEYLEDGSFYYKKVVNGNECDYYFRKYRKLTRADGGELRSDVNKLAYAENIYGDRMAQVLFIDDIDLTGMVDHMGRPVSEIYFTVVKRNAGRKEWYRNSDYGNEKVEFSHCFGEVTSGLDFGPFSGADMDYNVRFLHNVDTNKVYTDFTEEVKSALGESLSGIPKTIEKDITINQDEFYGDIIEFDPYNFVETEISPVLHRFNTEQRECETRSDYYPLYYTKIKTDNYDLDSHGFSQTFRTEDTNCSRVVRGETSVKIPANLRPEGYFYNPHTKVKVKESSEEVTRIRAKNVNYGEVSCRISLGMKDTTVKMRAPSSYNFLKWDYIAFCDPGGIVNGVDYSGVTAWGRIEEVSGLDLTIKVEGVPFGKTAAEAKDALIGEGRRFRAYYANESVPLYAAFNKSTQEFVWKGLRAPSELNSGMELYDTPFANGRFYLERNINFYLRRQDPFGFFGLAYAKHSDDDNGYVKNPMEYFNIDATMLDLSQIFFFYNNLDNICY